MLGYDEQVFVASLQVIDRERLRLRLKNREKKTQQNAETKRAVEGTHFHGVFVFGTPAFKKFNTLWVNRNADIY